MLRMNIYYARDQNDTRSDWLLERHVLNITKEQENDLPLGRKGVVFASLATFPNDPVFFLFFWALSHFLLRNQGAPLCFFQLLVLGKRRDWRGL